MKLQEIAYIVNMKIQKRAHLDQREGGGGRTHPTTPPPWLRPWFHVLELIMASNSLMSLVSVICETFECGAVSSDL